MRSKRVKDIKQLLSRRTRSLRLMNPIDGIYCSERLLSISNEPKWKRKKNANENLADWRDLSRPYPSGRQSIGATGLDFSVRNGQRRYCGRPLPLRIFWLRRQFNDRIQVIRVINDLKDLNDFNDPFSIKQKKSLQSVCLEDSHKMAATYSPADMQYHRRDRAWLLCSEWEEVGPRCCSHLK